MAEGFYIVPKRKMIPPEKDSPAINIIQQIQEGDTYYTEYRAEFPYRLQIPIGADMYDSGAINQQTMTFHPDPHPERATVDGYVDHSEAGLTWAEIIGAAGSYFRDEQTEAGFVYIKAHSTTDRWLTLDRGILLFDTSPLPDNCTVTAATLSVYLYGKDDQLGITPDINVYSSAPASNTALANGDFDSLGSTPFCDTAITYANATEGKYNNFALNAAGLAAISKTGITKLGLRNANYDVAGTIPAWSSERRAYFEFYTADKGEGYKPRLTVTYEEYGSSIWIEDEKFHFISETNTEQIALNESTFDANTILKADTDNTPEALTVAEQRLVGRITSGEVDALTGAQSMTVLSGQAAADFSMNSHKITSVTDPASNQDAATKNYVDTRVATSGSYFHDGDVDGGVISGMLGALDHLDINLDGGTL